MTRIGSQLRKTIWPTRHGGRLPTPITLPMESIRFTLILPLPIGTPQVPFLRGSAVSAGQVGLLASAMAARSCLPLLLTAVRVDSRNTFFKSVSLPICRPDLKVRMPK